MEQDELVITFDGQPVTLYNQVRTVGKLAWAGELPDGRFIRVIILDKET